MSDFYMQKKEDVLKRLNSSLNGLKKPDINIRLRKNGLNELKETKKISVMNLFFSQFKSFIIYILIAAAVVSLIASEIADSIVIVAIILLNAILGTYQEFKAEKAIQALKKHISLSVEVIRENKVEKINSKFLVPGDIIKLEAGSKIPADCYILSSKSLKVDESILTGESVSIDKMSGVITKNIPISDRYNMLFSSTTITNGSALAIITSTGMSSEIGKIAASIQEFQEKSTPLKERLNKLGIKITVSILIIASIIFFIGLSKGVNVIKILLSSIAIAVAAIPEGLPLILTLTLALGTLRMVKKQALMRKLAAVETLGSTTVICSDKTGTLTKNEMTVTKIFTNNVFLDVTGSGYHQEGNVLYNNIKYDTKKLQKLIEISYLCNNSELIDNGIIGDPTEVSLKVLAKKSRLEIKNYTRVNEIPFSSDKKYMATINKVDNKNILYMKGAPEIIIDKCKHIYLEGRLKLLSSIDKKKLIETNESFAKESLRVLALAYSKDGTEKNLIFVGLVAMLDPPRETVLDALRLTKKAGIKTIMITGDHKLTAVAIAKKINLGTNAITGEELDKISDTKLKKLVSSTDIFARVTPEHKVRILNALQENKEIVAMTGDGINDAPALKKADIGISVGSGTEVAKEASDMILLDDDFSTIVSAVEEGRSIFSNIKRFIIYLFSSNLGEVLTLFLALFFFNFFMDEVPLLVIHILWINLITDSLPAIALGIEPPEKDIMNKPPKSKNTSIIKKERIIDIVAIGILMSFGTLLLFKLNIANINYARTMAFTTLIVFQLMNAFNFKSHRSIFKTGILNNKKLIYAVLFSFILQLIVIYTPAINIIFKVTPINAIDWLYIFLVSSSVLIFIEIRKFLSSISSLKSST